MNWVLDDHKELLLILLGMLMCAHRWEQLQYACYAPNFFFETHTEIFQQHQDVWEVFFPPRKIKIDEVSMAEW